MRRTLTLGSAEYDGSLMRLTSNVFGNASSWTKFHYKLIGNRLYYYKESNKKKPKGYLEVAFCAADRIHFSDEEKANMDSSFAEFVEESSNVHRFRVYTPNEVVFLQAETEGSSRMDQGHHGQLV